MNTQLSKAAICVSVAMLLRHTVMGCIMQAVHYDVREIQCLCVADTGTAVRIVRQRL